MKILVMGLPGSGKTTLATVLARELGCAHYNADKVREQFNDWDFSAEGRLRQAHRMSDLADQHEVAICDFVCPLPEMRDIFDADFVIWVDRIEKGRFEDTNKVFVPPEKWDYRVISTLSSAEHEAECIVKLLNKLNHTRELENELIESYC